MPRGIPKSGKRAVGAGRPVGAKDKKPRQYKEPRPPPTDTISARVPVWVAKWFEKEAKRQKTSKGTLLAAVAEKFALGSGATPPTK